MPQDPQTIVKEKEFEAPVYAEEYLNYGDSPYLFPHVPLEPKVLPHRPGVVQLSEDSGNSSPHRGQALWLAMGRAYLRWIADARRSMACRYRQRLADISGQRGKRSIATQRIKAQLDVKESDFTALCLHRLSSPDASLSADGATDWSKLKE